MKKLKIKLSNSDINVGDIAGKIGGRILNYDEDEMVLDMEMEDEYDEEVIAGMEEVDSMEEVETEEEEVIPEDGAFKMPLASEFIKEAVEDESDIYGKQIAAINAWLKSDHPDHDEFDWDGDKLTITFEEGEDKTFTEAELATAIDGFPTESTVNEVLSKFLK